MLAVMEQKNEAMLLKWKQERAKNMKLLDEKEALRLQAQSAAQSEHQMKLQQSVLSNNLNELKDHIALLKSIMDRKDQMLAETNQGLKSNEIEKLTLKTERSCLYQELQKIKEVMQQQIDVMNEKEHECSRLQTEILKMAMQNSMKLKGSTIIGTRQRTNGVLKKDTARLR
mmetsp:Transcript_809/g.1236  ORF Transcript_809/g.1236 Transcript_809/m.1236 type:complete len:171 (+) Transcript_809:180-692(+)